MLKPKTYVITLINEQCAHLLALFKKGKAKARFLAHARILPRLVKMEKTVLALTISVVTLVLLIITLSISFAESYLDVCLSGCPFSTIQEAINSSKPGDTIRVVQGKYTENLSITGKTLLKIYGGYADNTFTVRDPHAYPTIIDGRGITNTIYILDSDGIIIDGFYIINGQAFDGAGVHIESSGLGHSTNVTIANSIISGNYATYAGGISAQASDSGHVTLHLLSNQVSNNRAERSGGGIGINARTSSFIQLISAGNVISNNQANNYGGGLYLNPEDSNSFVQFTSDSDQISGNLSGGGIGAYAPPGTGLSLIIKGSTVKNNNGGSGIFIYLSQSTAAITITNSSVSANSGPGAYSNGGGIFVSASSSTCSVDLTSNSIVNNFSFGYGGGIYISNGSGSTLNLTLNKNRISGNNIWSYYGGGLFLSNSGTVTAVMVNNVIVTNTATNATINCGGGVHIANSGSLNLNSINNTISGNLADDGGGGIYVSSSSGSAQLSFLNDIIYGNSGNPGSDIWNYWSSASITISHSDLGAVFGGYTDLGGNISADPLFRNPSAGDYHLTAGSPCIDKGTSSGAPPDDIEGTPRPQGGGVDMGAYEYVEETTPTPTPTAIPTSTPTPTPTPAVVPRVWLPIVLKGYRP